jgi:ABC-2 type transport system ATP-binding protein
MIQVEGLTKYYGDFRAVDRVSFYADVGEIVGFVGRNGAGKTTTIRILTGYMPPTSGSAKVAGFDVFEQSLDVRRRVGYLPETVPLYKEMTVWQYVNYMASLRGMRNPERTQRVETVLDMVDMLDRENSLVANISRGMRQRIGLAQSIVHNPDVLILDEPTAGLDPDQRIEMRETIREIGQDRTVFLSSHDLAELEKLCTRILVIDQGRIVAEDTPEALAGRLEGQNRFFIGLRGVDLAEAATLIGKLPGVTAAMLTDKGIEVSSSKDVDARPDVAAAVVKKKWELMELRPLAFSLEDIFLQLTGHDGDDESKYADKDGEE